MTELALTFPHPTRDRFSAYSGRDSSLGKMAHWQCLGGRFRGDSLGEK
jgi:hypothetical protein